MTSVERVDSALEDLEEQFRREERRFCDVDEKLIEQGTVVYIHRPQSVFQVLLSVRIHIETFKVEFRFLKMFLDCIYKWGDANGVVQNSGSLVVKIEAVVGEIETQLGKKIYSVETGSKTTTLMPIIMGKNDLKLAAREKKGLEEWASKLIEVFSNLNAKIEYLKQDIREVYDSFSRNSFPSRSPMHDYSQWKKFVHSVESNLKVLHERAYFSDPLQEQIRAFKEKLNLVTFFIGRLAGSFSKNPKIEDFMIHVGSVVISAAVLSCDCWIRQLDSKKANEMTHALLDLQLKIDLTTPKFLDLNLTLLKNFGAIKESKEVNVVNIFVDYLLHFRVKEREYFLGSIMTNALYMELVSLIISVINIPEEYSEQPESLLADLKSVVVELGSHKHLLHRGYETRILLLNLLAKIWLMKMEIFLKQQLTTGHILKLSTEEQINVLNQELKNMDLEEGLRFMRKLFAEQPEEKTEKVEKILMFMEELQKMVASLNHSFHAKELPQKMLGNLLFNLLLQILLFKAKSFLIELHSNCRSWLVHVKDQIECVYGGLKFLTIFVRNQTQGSVEDEKQIFAHIGAVSRWVISFYHSFSTDKISEKIIKSMNLWLFDLLCQIDFIMLRLKEIYVHIPRSNYPKTNGLGFIDSLLRNLRELLNDKADLIASVKPHVEEISGYLEFMRSFLRDILDQDIEIQELKELRSRVMEVAYEVEYFIGSVVVGSDTEWHNLLFLYHLLKDVRLIKTQITEIYGKKTYDVKVHNVPPTSSHRISHDITPRIDEVVVGLNDQEEVIINRLTRGSMQQDIVSIVGMAGIGKTTLAKKVYNNPKTMYHFHVRAWCCVSQKYQKRELLLDILSHIFGLTDDILETTDEDLELKLYQCLKQKRYLIVMDDMWNSGALDDLRRSFPNDGNGSRIVITSRLHDVALKAKPDSNPHPIHLLSDDESWDLLKMKVFHEEGCPEELLEVGKEIARNCKGLPLAVVAIAGLLERTNRTKDWWKQISETLSSRVVDDPQMQCMDILGLSYKHLPDYLKACFLYFGAFPRDKDIPVWKLIWLWVAEGFVQQTGLKSLEDLAEDYLMDLISRSLVIAAKHKSDGGVKSCRVHDMLRDLCLSKAKEENFSRVVGNQDPDAYDGFDYGVDFDSFNPLNSMTYEDYRLCICSKRKHFVLSRPSGPRACSLLVFATSDMYPRCPYDISFIFNNFKLLKVLDLECINMGYSFPSGIESLVHLRYLAASGDIDSIPSSIANLWNLETFLVKGLKGKVVLPDTIWCMKKLRHLHVKNYAAFSLPHDKFENFSELDNLVTLSSAFLSYGEDTKKILRRFPNLRKLRCIFSESRGYYGNGNSFPRLDLLTQVESLNILYYGSAVNHGALSFPLNLKKLTLSYFRLPWNHISAIGMLQSLEVLKLLNRAFEGESWDMKEGDFSKLKFLKLDSLNIAKWNASSDHLPNLQKLVLRSCKQLEEVPFSFGDIPTLQMIEVQFCGQSTEESVRKIKDEGIEGLKVTFSSTSRLHQQGCSEE